MADDGTSGFDEGIAGLQSLIDNYDVIQRKALLAAAKAVAPRLIDAAPVRVSAKQGGNSLEDYALRGSVRAYVARDKQTKRLQACLDFGDLTYIAGFVDLGHQAPSARLAKKLSIAAGKPTAAHPFVRSVQDSQQSTAQQAYADAITQGMTEALQGK